MRLSGVNENQGRLSVVVGFRRPRRVMGFLSSFQTSPARVEPRGRRVYGVCSARKILIIMPKSSDFFVVHYLEASD